MEKYQKFRKEFPRFIYDRYELEESADSLKIRYWFQIPGLSSFCPEWTFPKTEGEKCWSEDPLIREMIFSLGMVELVSYWKITCSPQVEIQAGSLSREQAKWWKNLYFHGLGEFFYVNQIWEADPESFMQICCDGKEAALPCAPAEPDKQPAGLPISAGVLVPIGGGKDSAVTLELLKKAGEPVTAYIINPRGATIHTTEAADLDAAHVISVKRTLDKNMLELNRQGYLNGHTPFSALVAFSGVIAARMAGLSYVALSNESSANESTVAGSTVNHQYSKSFQFEKDFHRYRKRWLPGSALYFSMLRPLSEFQIAKYFAGLKQYHGIFRSCNVGSKTDSWCGHCPKCLFVSIILSPFLSSEELREIFGKDLLQDESMKETLNQLIGLREEKPFECVGSRDEINTALVLTADKRRKEKEALPALLEYYCEAGFYDRYKGQGDPFSTYFDRENLIPKPWEKLVFDCCAQAGEGGNRD